jgi:hypothetical protein
LSQGEGGVEKANGHEGGDDGELGAAYETDGEGVADARGEGIDSIQALNPKP